MKNQVTVTISEVGTCARPIAATWSFIPTYLDYLDGDDLIIIEVK